MSTRSQETRQRKDVILAITVDQYIKTVTPVSSSYIAQIYPSGVSSATVRNVLAELEDDGYLTHPHTSAGRMPTQRGYRYYVDHLMSEINLLEEEKRLIREEYEHESKELEGLLEKTSQMISDLTQYTTIVSVDGWENKIICRGTNYVVDYPESQDIEKIQNILTALEEKEKLLEIINQSLRQKIQIYIGQEIALKPQYDHLALDVSYIEK